MPLCDPSQYIRQGMTSLQMQPQGYVYITYCRLWLLSTYCLLSAYMLPAFNPSVLSLCSYRIIIVKCLHTHGVKLLRWPQERQWLLERQYSYRRCDGHRRHDNCRRGDGYRRGRGSYRVFMQRLMAGSSLRYYYWPSSSSLVLVYVSCLRVGP